MVKTAYCMKRLVLLFCILLSLPAFARTPAKTVSKTHITAAIAECRLYSGTEMVRLGRLSTAALKGVIRLAALDDPDARKALGLMKGIHGITVLDYADCKAEDREAISGKLERALSGSEMLMEASDEGEKMKIYGLVDDQMESVRDFVLFSPTDCSLICLFGSIPMEALEKVASHD